MATLEQIKAKMKELQAQADALISKRSRAVLDDIRALMDQHNLTTADIDAHHSSPARRGRPRGAVSQSSAAPKQASSKSSSPTATKAKLPAKYRNPKTGQTWSGWARPPAWIAKVKDRTKFLIGVSSAEANSVATQRATTNRAGSQPAAKKRASAKASVSSASAPTQSTTPKKAPGASEPVATKAARKAGRKVAAKTVKPAAAPAPATKSGATKAVAKKAVAKKAAPKKSAAKKVTTAKTPARKAISKRATAARTRANGAALQPTLAMPDTLSTEVPMTLPSAPSNGAEATA
ncbi:MULTISPECIES: H-NS histone family protein [unclassified Caballeronia]|uniref:H-NS histone family protein n=1 Tax=unclassified Caballeronia TaxID=2646786 RepID=UPI00285862BF|nr:MULTISPECIES: H-NS histone family protein [unclassified Caballeronia]MDR5755119.1 H-NS histone family protein [Caballeronia sp. LZ024]MDR5845329.1 H-NS histone family protein [Caballeronia sp. LZ031]